MWKRNETFCKLLLQTCIVGHYNPSIRIIHLVSRTTYVVSVNFTHKRRDLQFKIDSERQTVWETFCGYFMNSQSFYQKFAEKKFYTTSQKKKKNRKRLKSIVTSLDCGVFFLLFLHIYINTDKQTPVGGGTYSLKSTPYNRFFWETFHGNFIYSLS